MDSSNPMLHPNLLIGPCQRRGQIVCTDKADVAFPLLKLGKTMKSPTTRTRQIIQENRSRQNMSYSRILVHPNPVFLITWEQLTESSLEKQKQLVEDLEYFFGIHSDLSFLELPIDRNQLPTKSPKDPHLRKLNICDGSHRPLRRALVDISRRSAQWIRDDFLASTTVTCSQMDWLVEHLDLWMKDPCSVAGLGAPN